MRMPDQILNTVCFISPSTADIKYRGTAFIVAVRGGHGNAYLHLVTAKHVAKAVEGAPFVIGINTKKGSKAILDADLEAKGMKWWYHPTEPDAVDAAVTLFSPSLEHYEELDVEWVFEDMFTTPEIVKRAGIGIGDEIAIVGLFTAFSGKDRHFPIARIGNLAMLPTEKIPVKGFTPMETYLAEGRSIGGLSGSPVFVRETLNMLVQTEDGFPKPLGGVGQIHFLGLMHGHWDVPKDFSAVVQVEVVNMGISIIVPAHKIMEVVNHPELVEMRKRYDKMNFEENLPTQDILADEGAQEFSRNEDFGDALKRASRKINSKG